VLSDSTANEDGEWMRPMAGELAARYPGHRVLYSKWYSEGSNVAGSAYRPAVTVQDGPAGAPTLHVWNGAVPGWSARSPLGPQFRALVVDPDPDQVIVSYGHNEGNSGRADDEARWRGQMVPLTDALRDSVPAARLTLTLQNPQYASDVQARRAVVYREIATARGFGLLDVAPLFLADPNWRTDWMLDDRHPNTTGEQLWANEATHAVLDGVTVTPHPPPTGPTVLWFDADVAAQTSTGPAG
jgi:lysophospholipase L1-like esterase